MIKKIKLVKNNNMKIILLFFCLLVLFIITAQIKIQIKDLKFVNNQFDNVNFKILIGLYLFGKLKILWVNIDNNKIKRLNGIKLPQKFKFNKLDIKIDKELLNLRKKIRIDVQQFNFKLYIDSKNIFIQTYSIPAIATILSIILSKVVKSNNYKNISYKIIPKYSNTNSIDLDFKCIISIKIAHIINMSYSFIKKVRSDKHERMSNRRSYGYSHE